MVEKSKIDEEKNAAGGPPEIGFETGSLDDPVEQFKQLQQKEEESSSDDSSESKKEEEDSNNVEMDATS